MRFRNCAILGFQCFAEISVHEITNSRWNAVCSSKVVMPDISENIVSNSILNASNYFGD